MRVLVGVMGVMIVLGLGVVVATIIERGGHAARGFASTTLDEPAGTRIAGATEDGGRLVLTLQGGGPDRVVVVTDGREVARVELSR